MRSKGRTTNSKDEISKEKRYGVSVITSTNRPQFFKQLIHNFSRQQFKHKELIVILNHDNMNLKEYRRKARDKRIKIYQLPSKMPLGHCLNYAADQAKYGIISKFDDDDYYGPLYLKNQLESLVRNGADIVGKRACLIFLEAHNQLVLRYPKLQNRFVKFVAGSTLMMKRALVKKIPFNQTSPGECVNFMERCRGTGYKIYSTDYLDYVAVRRNSKKGHTWKVCDKTIRSQSILIAKNGKNYRKYAISTDKDKIKPDL